MKFNQGPVVIRRCPPTKKGFSIYAQNVDTKLTKNVLLPTPPDLASYGAEVAALIAADGIKHKTPEDVADRDAKALKVYRHIGHFVDYVQGVADTQVSPADAIAVILSSGLDVRKSGGFKKPTLTARYTGITTEVQLTARAVRGAGAYYWEYSLDQKTWTTVPETTAPQTIIAGLTPGQMYSFRFRALTSKGKLAYVQPVSLMAH